MTACSLRYLAPMPATWKVQVHSDTWMYSILLQISEDWGKPGWVLEYPNKQSLDRSKLPVKHLTATQPKFYSLSTTRCNLDLDLNFCISTKAPKSLEQAHTYFEFERAWWVVRQPENRPVVRVYSEGPWGLKTWEIRAWRVLIAGDVRQPDNRVEGTDLV
jgi:hypothetical protein